MLQIQINVSKFSDFFEKCFLADKQNHKHEKLVDGWVEEGSYLKNMVFIVWAPLTNAVAIPSPNKVSEDVMDSGICWICIYRWKESLSISSIPMKILKNGMNLSFYSFMLPPTPWSWFVKMNLQNSSSHTS